jgi:hypothetical protein
MGSRRLKVTQLVEQTRLVTRKASWSVGTTQSAIKSAQK